jgi:Uma2 family endonuclease
MSTTAQPTITAVPAALEVPGPVTRVPSLEEIERLTEVPDRRVVFRGVDWAFYEQLVDSIPQRSNIHVDYDGRDLEVMSKGWKHEDIRYALGQFVSLVAAEMAIPCKGLGETTWKRPEIARGLEADQCYYFLPAKLVEYARVRGQKDIALVPNPDLAIEVDISHPKIDRPSIYAALKVSEIWRFTAIGLTIERLNDAGSYEVVDSSGFLPIRSEEIIRWVLQEDRSNLLAWKRRLRAWVQAELVPRQAQ